MAADDVHHLRQITDALPILISYIDAGGRYRFTNRTYEEWFGLDREEMRGALISEVWDAAVTEQITGVMDRVLAGETVVTDIDIPDRSGEVRRLRSTYVPDSGPGEVVRGFYGYVQDDTDRSRAEARVQQLNDELESRVLDRTAELAAANLDLESFSYSVSHDLRGPLRAIDGYSRLLQETCGEELPVTGLRYLDAVRENARRMGRLIEGLLAMAHIGRGEIRVERVDQERLVNECVDDVRAGRPDQAIDVQVENLAPADADPALLRQIWANLLGNAAKYSATRPVTVVRVGSYRQDGETVHFCRDNGTGFDMRHAGKLFEPFHRLHDEDFEGLGIGLATVQRIVRFHHGRIWAEAEPDRGAIFFFTLAAPFV